MQLVPETDGDPIEDHLLFILGSLGKLGQNLQTATGSVLMSVCPHMAGPGHSHGTVSGNFVLWIIVKTGQRTATLLKTVQERAVDMKSYWHVECGELRAEAEETVDRISTGVKRDAL
jgi:hypothetical protein